MKSLLALFILLIGLTAGAQVEDYKLSPEELAKQGFTPGEIQLKKSYELYLKLGIFPNKPTFQLNATNEQEAIAELKSDRKHTRRFLFDDLAQSFVDVARYAFSNCGVEDAFKKAAPRKWNYFNKHFYEFVILSVPFNLCRDDQSTCDFESSFTAKNFPKMGLILVNAYKWNLLTLGQRHGIAVHEYLGLAQVEEGTYGLSSDISFGEIKYQQGPYVVTQRTCLNRSEK